MATGEEIKANKEAFEKSWMPYYLKRYYFFFLVSIVSLALPFIKINDHHIFLLSFDHKRLELLGVAFDMQELYLMPFLLILLFMFIFFLTTLGGRVWCGWTCPQTIFRVVYREFIQEKLLGLRKRRDKQKEPNDKIKTFLSGVIWTVFAFLAASNFLWYFVPPEDFFPYMADPLNHPVLIGAVLLITAFLVYDVIWLAEDFCIYVCPYARIQSVMYDSHTIMEVYDEKRGGAIYDADGNKISDKPSEGDCVGCMACVKVCPTHIDIRKGLQLECINCLECADACAPIMGALGKENLIKWTSYHHVDTGEKTKIFRFRILAYIVMMSIAFAGLLFMGSKKESMLLNINRTSELYLVKDGGKEIDNIYSFLFQNTDAKAHEFFFEIEGSPDINISRPTEPFKLDPGGKAKKIVVLTTQKQLATSDRRDTPIPIKIKAFATDDKAKIFVLRDTIFFYPSADVIKAKQEAK
jgi:cytochrome c oxidase accessory protein FixG